MRRTGRADRDWYTAGHVVVFSGNVDEEVEFVLDVDDVAAVEARFGDVGRDGETHAFPATALARHQLPLVALLVHDLLCRKYIDKCGGCS